METAEDFEAMRKRMSHIKGWGVDADPENEPNYPYKIYTGDDHKRLAWDRPPRQKKTIEVLQSVEHLRRPAVFGTVAPPSGLSGAIRRAAFKYSENMLRHWLLLIMADRVDALEELAKDLSRGHIPNLSKERGFDAMWDHDKALLARRVAVRITLYTAVLGLISYSILKNKKTKALVKREALA